MIEKCFPYFVDELTKLAVSLTADERQQQAIQFAALGTAAAPIASGVGNLISHGKLSPWTSKPRWLAGRMAAGLIGGAALPYAQHAIERASQGTAQERLRRARISRALKEYYRRNDAMRQ